MIASLRSRRAVFWHLAADRIVAAVVSRAEREPVLEACAASYSPPLAGALFAPGVLEVSWVLGSEGHPHVAALAASFCRVEQTQDEVAPSSRRRRPRIRRGWRAVLEDGGVDGELAGVVSGAKGVRVWAAEGAVKQAASLFRRARLHLVALDCEPCALASLADALGSGDVVAARRQPLAAVAVMPESETAAEALGEDLAIPVGLALAWFGGGRAI